MYAKIHIYLFICMCLPWAELALARMSVWVFPWHGRGGCELGWRPVAGGIGLPRWLMAGLWHVLG